jgi:polyphosphate kinase
MNQSLKAARNFFNREISWLRFNERVLEEAEDATQPLLERLKFLSIFSSNLDEFFMIRVAGLKEQIHAGIKEHAPDGLGAAEQLNLISEITHRLVQRQSRLLVEEIIPQLRRKDIRIRKFSTLNDSQRNQLSQYYHDKIFPLLTPLGVDPTHPFPELRNLSINLMVELRTPLKRTEKKVAVVPMPTAVNRFIPIPGKAEFDFVLLEDFIVEHLDTLFPNMKIMQVSEFRITRNADLDLSEAEADDLLKLIELELRKRRLGVEIRLEVSDRMTPDSRRFLQGMMEMKEHEIYDISGYLDMASFMFLTSLDIPDSKDLPFTPAFSPAIMQADNIFAAIRKEDILLHHPYDQFSHVIELIQGAAKDPRVLAIKQTLYRTSGRSQIAHALREAAGNGKQVTALIELKARFDEETNIVWAKELEKAGVYVVYGMLGLKTHCKMCMVVRHDEDDQIRSYLHVSTGNYNEKTAKVYTDFGILTCDPLLGKDFSDLFNLLTGFSGQEKWNKVLVAPVNMREEMVHLIQNCIKSNSVLTPSRIVMVMNSLVDPDMIAWLYKASMKGVKVELVVRGICCLRPGVKGMSENITVRSIVGRFLEHSRIYAFWFDSERHVYTGSADMMQRNLNRRVELLIPITHVAIQERVISVAELMLRDNTKARILQSDGEYVRLSPQEGEEAVNSQARLLQLAQERQLLVDTIREE